MKALYHLFAGKPFEFYTAHPIEIIEDRLYSLQQQSENSFERIDVTITPNDSFYCSLSQGTNVEVHCKGEMIPQTGGAYIQGRTYLGHLAYSEIILTFIWLVVWTAVTLSNSIFVFTIAGIGMAFFMIRMLIRQQNRLHNAVHHVLGKSTKKKKNGAQ